MPGALSRFVTVRPPWHGIKRSQGEGQLLYWAGLLRIWTSVYGLARSRASA